MATSFRSRGGASISPTYAGCLVASQRRGRLGPNPERLLEVPLATQGDVGNSPRWKRVRRQALSRKGGGRFAGDGRVEPIAFARLFFAVHRFTSGPLPVAACRRDILRRA